MDPSTMAMSARLKMERDAAFCIPSAAGREILREIVLASGLSTTPTEVSLLSLAIHVTDGGPQAIPNTVIPTDLISSFIIICLKRIFIILAKLWPLPKHILFRTPDKPMCIVGVNLRLTYWVILKCLFGPIRPSPSQSNIRSLYL